MPRPARIVVDSEWWVSIPSIPPLTFTIHGKAKVVTWNPLIRVRCYIAVFYDRIHRVRHFNGMNSEHFFLINEKSRHCYVYMERTFRKWRDAIVLHNFAQNLEIRNLLESSSCAKVDRHLVYAATLHSNIISTSLIYLFLSR